MLIRCKNEEHKKVYADVLLLSFPPQHPWICERCGVKGVDRETNTPHPSYADIELIFKL